MILASTVRKPHGSAVTTAPPRRTPTRGRRGRPGSAGSPAREGGGGRCPARAAAPDEQHTHLAGSPTRCATAPGACPGAAGRRPGRGRCGRVGHVPIVRIRPVIEIRWVPVSCGAATRRSAWSVSTTPSRISAPPTTMPSWMLLVEEDHPAQQGDQRDDVARRATPSSPRPVAAPSRTAGTASGWRTGPGHQQRPSPGGDAGGHALEHQHERDQHHARRSGTGSGERHRGEGPWCRLAYAEETPTAMTAPSPSAMANSGRPPLSSPLSPERKSRVTPASATSIPSNLGAVSGSLGTV